MAFQICTTDDSPKKPWKITLRVLIDYLLQILINKINELFEQYLKDLKIRS